MIFCYTFSINDLQLLQNLLISWSLLAILSRIVFGILHELLAILQKFLGQVGTQRMFGLGIVDQRYQCIYHLIRACRRLPVLSAYDGQTHLTLLIDIRMIDFRLEHNLWWLKGILGWKIDFNAKSALVVWWIIGHNQAGPTQQIIIVRGDFSKRFQTASLQIRQLLTQSTWRSHVVRCVCLRFR